MICNTFVSHLIFVHSFVSYFQIADRNGDGVITGDEARQFFQVCNLPSSTLAKIWAVADHMVRR